MGQVEGVFGKSRKEKQRRNKSSFQALSITDYGGRVWGTENR